jgi:hypothetical protein
MKVDSTRATGTLAARKSGKAGRSDGAALSKLLQSAGQDEAVSGAKPVGSVDALLAV